MVDLSIVIVSWNTRELLRDCLSSLYEHTKGIMFEVFVIDNASSDGSAEMVRALFPEVNLIENKENAGFSKANNQAIRVSKGRYVALLNPDTHLIENVFSPLIGYADSHEKVGAIGPKIFLGGGKSIQHSCARRLPNLYFEFCRLSGLSSRFPETRIFGGMYMTYWDHKSPRYVEALSGACMVVKKNAIDDVGLLDENQFMYGDEIDWCKRILDTGWDIYYFSGAAIIHYGGESSKQANIHMSIEAEKALMYFYKKHKGKLNFIMFSLQVFLFSYGKFIISMFFRPKNIQVKELMRLYKSTFIWSFKVLFGKENYSLNMQKRKNN